jgi:Tol biopolymer transport system component
MTFFYKILTTIFVLATTVFIAGCDFCNDAQGDYVMEESDIYYTSSPVNSHETGIFRIGLDGKGIREIVKNAQIYSRPSKTKKIVFTSYYAPGTKFIYKANIDGTKAEVLKKEDFANNMLYPQISYNGKHIVVNDATNGLYLIREDKSVLKLTGNFCMNTLPSFSPDGTKLAYYEGVALYEPLSVVILNMEEDPPVEITRKIHSNGLEKYAGEATIAWSPDGEKVCYVISKDKITDYLYIGDFSSPADKAYEITSIGAYQPSLTNDLKRVVFAARDGNLWIRNLVDTVKRYIRITSSGRVSKSLYPEWSKDEKHILYVKQFKDEADRMNAALEIIDLDKEPPVSRVLSNNVYKGYWNFR